MNQILLMVLGYRVCETKAGSTIGYSVIPYPVGFLTMDKVMFVPMDQEMRVVSEGKLDPQSRMLLDSFEKHLEEIHSASDKTSLLKEQFRKMMQMREGWTEE